MVEQTSTPILNIFLYDDDGDDDNNNKRAFQSEHNVRTFVVRQTVAKKTKMHELVAAPLVEGYGISAPKIH